MPWEQRYFKGNKKVYAEVDDAGEYVTAKGLVNTKFSSSEDAKIYTVHSSNLSTEEGPAPAGSKKKKSSGGKKKSSGGKKAASAGADIVITDPAGPKVVSDVVPAELRGLAPPADGIVEIYTDGACTGNPGPCSYGMLRREGDSYYEVSQWLGHGTNNIGELWAIKVAIEELEDRGAKVLIHTDSSYSIGVLSKGWKAKANVALITEIKSLLATCDDVTFVKVKGHSGLPLNERADRLAVEAIERDA